jgi:uncharacterized phage protein gp47/JayE
MNIAEFENAVWAIEGVRIVIRSNSGDEIEDYDYKRAAQDTWRVTQLLDNRIYPKTGNREILIVQGDGEQPHGSVILRTLRGSYQGI